jgi:hypothetical protein
MKKYIIILTLLLVVSKSFGQHDKETREKIKALKVAYLTQELKLNAKEAQKFWPVYHKHQEELDFSKNKIRSVGDLENLEEADAKKLTLLIVALDKKMVSAKEAFISETSKFMSYKKIMKLYLSEREFARKLMRKYGKGRKRGE